MVQFLKFLSFRLFFTLILFFPVIYLLEEISLNQSFKGFSDNNTLYLLLVFLLILSCFSFAVSSSGKYRILRKLQDIGHKRDVKLQEMLAAFENMYITTFSAKFTQSSGESLREAIIEKFSDLLATESSNDFSLRKVLEKSVLIGVSSQKVKEALCSIYCSQERLSDQELFYAEVIYKELNDSALLDKIIEECLIRRSVGINARHAYKVAFETEHVKCIDIAFLLLKGYLDGDGSDELGAWLFLFIHEHKEKFDIDPQYLHEKVQEIVKAFATKQGALADKVRTLQSEHNSSFDNNLTVESFETTKNDNCQAFEGLLVQNDGTAHVSIAVNKPSYLRYAWLSLGGVFILAIVFIFFGNNASKEVNVIEKQKVEETIDVRTIPKKEAPLSITSNENVVTTDKPFTIQLAAFKNQNDANAFVEKVRKVNKSVYINLKEGKGTWYRIRLGFFENQDDARKLAEELKGKKLMDSYYITSFDGGVWSLNHKKP